MKVNMWEVSLNEFYVLYCTVPRRTKIISNAADDFSKEELNGSLAQVHYVFYKTKHETNIQQHQKSNEKIQ